MYNWSKSTGKMSGIPSLNTDTTTNEFCKKMSKTDTICGSCYSWRMMTTIRKNCQPRWKLNSDYLSAKVHDRDYLPKVDSIVARFNAHGELINREHLLNLINVCINQPLTTFTLFTKRKDIVQDVFKEIVIPSNMILVYSNSIVDKVMKRVPKYFHKVFNVVTKDSEIVNCRGKCITCMKCYTTTDTTEQIIEKIK